MAATPPDPRLYADRSNAIPGWVAGLVATSIALALGAWLWLDGAHLDPTARDQVHDLSLAIRIREGTSLSDGNRHPLFPALLAPFAGRDPDFQTRALIVGIVVTVLALLAVYRASSKIFSRALGVAAIVALVIEFRLQGRRICPENLVAGLLAVSAAFLALGSDASGRRAALRTLAGGAVLGLAWLAKGSAMLSLLAAIGWLAFSGGAGRARRVGVVLAGFLLTAWPLMAWNVLHGHQPLFNVNSAHVMWEDGWDGDLDRRSTATLASWWAGHSVADGVRRLAKGLVSQRGIEFVYVTFVVLGIDAWRRRRHKTASSGAPAAWGSFAVWTGTIWLLAFAWYAPIVSSRRLLFPIFPVLVPPVLAVVSGWVRIGGDRFAAIRARAVPILCVASAALLVAGGVLFARGGAPGARVPIDPVWLEAADAMRRNCQKGSRVLVRPSRTYPPDWLLEGHVTYVELPAAVGDGAFSRWFDSVDYVLLNPGLRSNRPTLPVGGGDGASRPWSLRVTSTWRELR